MIAHITYRASQQTGPDDWETITNVIDVSDDTTVRDIVTEYLRRKGIVNPPRRAFTTDFVLSVRFESPEVTP